MQKIRKPFAHTTISHPKLLAINDCVLLKRLLAVSSLTRVTPMKDEIRNREMKNLLKSMLLSIIREKNSFVRHFFKKISFWTIYIIFIDSQAIIVLMFFWVRNKPLFIR